MHFRLLQCFALLGAVLAQRPTDTSICDYYTADLLKENNGTNQVALLVLIVNTAVVGNYSEVNVGVKVPGILAPGMYNGTQVNLLPYFSGGLASTNNGGSSGVVENFLDDGGATPLLMNLAANGTTSKQYTLLTHLYQFFGQLLGCSKIGTSDFPTYSGDKSMYEVHKYMALDAFQVGYFINQVGLSAASFGVSAADVEAVGMALQSLFGYKCAAPATVVPSQGPQLQAVCIADNCPLAPNGNCSAYDKVAKPLAANASGIGIQTTASMSGPASATTTTSGGVSSNGMASKTSMQGISASSGAANHTGMAAQMAAHLGPAAVLVGAAALAFAL